jgi:hypothetical protein
MTSAMRGFCVDGGAGASAVCAPAQTERPSSAEAARIEPQKRKIFKQAPESPEAGWSRNDEPLRPNDGLNTFQIKFP